MQLPLTANQFPEKMFIQRLLEANEELVQIISEVEYLQFVSDCKTGLKQI